MCLCVRVWGFLLLARGGQLAAVTTLMADRSEQVGCVWEGQSISTGPPPVSGQQTATSGIGRSWKAPNFVAQARNEEVIRETRGSDTSQPDCQLENGISTRMDDRRFRHSQVAFGSSPLLT